MAAVATREHRQIAVDRPRWDLRSGPFEDGVTLEDVVLGTWEDLVSAGRASCPVCGGPIAAGHGCAGCGSELS